ncbi:MAG: DNA recombination protein RmuC [Bacteroidales bacterium]|nr:DNA recombination protein RmuC [Bacteroidales bacterium]
MIINLTTIIGALVGILLGALVCALILRNKANVLKTNLENANQRLEEVKNQAKADAEAAEANLQKRLSEVKADEQKHYQDALASQDKANEEAMQVLKEHYDTSIREQQQRFDETMAKIADQNKAATEELLKARQKEFVESSSSSIGQLVNPLKESIEKMEKEMRESSVKAVEINSAMKENLEEMIRQSKSAQATTEELTNAFKHQSKVQGDWGEAVLAELLTSQGLMEGVHFHTQAPIRDEKGEIVRNDRGSLMRPDVILHLDQKREVVIDSKVSLTAFLDYVNAETESDKQQCLKAHVASLQKHVDELSKKDYSSYIQPPKVKMDYVIMFVPHSGALWTALNEQPDLWRKAMEKNVYIADEQSLYAALKIISMTWTQIKQAENHEAVYKLASEMVDRVGQFVEHYEAVGKALKNAQSAYDNGKGKLAVKGQSIVHSAQKLIDLGAKNGKHAIPPMLDVDEV